MKKLLLLFPLFISFNSKAMIIDVFDPQGCRSYQYGSYLDCTVKNIASVAGFTTTSLPTILVLDDGVELQTEDFLAEIIIETIEEDRPMTDILAKSLNIPTEVLSSYIDNSLNNDEEINLGKIVKDFL